tara:strand:+ start:25054 stop:25278 length:225 start_codon:yes stop_codon:yes gene_type:complete
MNPKLKLVIIIVIAILLLTLFFWAVNGISTLTGHSITGTSIANPVGIDTEIDDGEDVGDDIGVEEINTESSNGP